MEWSIYDQFGDACTDDLDTPCLPVLLINILYYLDIMSPPPLLVSKSYIHVSLFNTSM